MINMRQYLIKQHNGIPIRNNPHEITMPCPECKKEKDHFRYNVRKQIGGCWKCSYAVRGDIKFIQKLTGYSKNKASLFYYGGTIEANKMDAARKILTGLQSSETTIAYEKEYHKNAELPAEYVPIIDPNRKPAIIMPKVISHRKYSNKTIYKMKIGFCRSGKYSARIIFPLYCNGMTSFYARRIYKWMGNKYKNPPESKHEQLLYNYDNIPMNADMVFVVEGATDVLRMVDRGYHAVGTSGKKISSEQIDLLVIKKPKEVVVLFDGDASAETIKAFQKLSSRLNASYGVLPEKGDRCGLKNNSYDPDDIPENLLEKVIENRYEFSKLKTSLKIIRKHAGGIYVVS